GYHQVLSVLQFSNQRCREIAQRFSSLEVLDQEAITQISFDLPVSSSAPKEKQSENKTFPCEMGASFVTGVDGSIVSTFLVRYAGPRHYFLATVSQSTQVLQFLGHATRRAP